MNLFDSKKDFLTNGYNAFGIMKNKTYKSSKRPIPNFANATTPIAKKL